MLGPRSWRALGLCYLACAGAARAQTDHWWLGGGLVVPSGEYSMHDKAGWHAVAAFSPLLFGRDGAFGLRIDALYGQTPRKTTPSATSQVFGLGATLVVRPTHGVAVRPYLIAGIGYYELEEGAPGGVSSSPVNGIALVGGAGASFRTGGLHVFLETRFIGGPVKNGVNFFPVTLGLSF
jgi:hypothetical protein